ncbi:Hypothetical protein FKW44_000898 [Caligus rogercresseyi]|uniref:Uncharacterized protein n=1 Tax=Caligus rogercresseyi TaxID=217165 RepID=A0A7T8QV63_CALRO|nr:Hypothetical protein FKW44_000898 [Caligus rogercresseyi]
MVGAWWGGGGMGGGLCPLSTNRFPRRGASYTPETNCNGTNTPAVPNFTSSHGDLPLFQRQVP